MEPVKTNGRVSVVICGGGPGMASDYLAATVGAAVENLRAGGAAISMVGWAWKTTGLRVGLKAQTKHLASVCAQLDGSLLLVAHSAALKVALSLAADPHYRDRICGLIDLCGLDRRLRLPLPLALRAYPALLLRYLTHPLAGLDAAITSTYPRLAARYYFAAPTPALVGMFARSFAPGSWRLLLASNILRADVRGRLPHVVMPVLSVAGADDRIVPVQQVAERVARLGEATRSRLVTLPDAGHFAALESPAIQEILTDFIGRLSHDPGLAPLHPLVAEARLDASD